MPVINLIIVIAYVAAVILVPSENSTGSFFDLFKGFSQTPAKNSRKVIHDAEEQDIDNDNKGE
ncbi:hypothetical protein [Lentilactobacillus kosonis]|uniref:Uncharacterized protein n=1 Tax=Lentilactobacillus kosonis TaxID=2810561 RepID=A0A401FK10_9LACO|nr:hypothetical protein [Lentilactobacillus kosonis]GAY72683.1 hypothetical protein NBRC111893_829 [Lentilactobacillus kosonis]